ncbi:hypothetical protein AB1Y20_002437 [Prymnesium parvum]|uniref:Uncharacterized protein n=1 Tax=Prymnesium parvum TaxID=97485 RepID=A0AB34JB33_PRYPA
MQPCAGRPLVCLLLLALVVLTGALNAMGSAGRIDVRHCAHRSRHPSLPPPPHRSRAVPYSRPRSCVASTHTSSLALGASALGVSVSGAVGTACFALLLAPQALLNARRRTTDGLSLKLVLLWHLGSIIYGAALLASRASPWILASMASFSAMSAVLEAQVAVYNSTTSTPLLAYVALGISISCLAIWLMGSLLASLPAHLLSLVGHVLPAAFFAVGFLPQLRIFLTSRSVEGYSFGVTLLDVIGSGANVYVIARTRAGWAQALPFLVIIGFHGVLVAIAAWIVLNGAGSTT